MKTKLYNLLVTFFFISQVFAEPFTNPITGWTYNSSTEQAVYYFDNILVDSLEFIDASGIFFDSLNDEYICFGLSAGYGSTNAVR